MASAVARAYNGGLGAAPPAGSRGRAPGQGVWGGGRSPPEVEHNYTFHKPIFAEFWCHFGKMLSFCKLLKLAPTYPLAVSYVSIIIIIIIIRAFVRRTMSASEMNLRRRCCFDKLMYVRSIGFTLRESTRYTIYSIMSITLQRYLWLRNIKYTIMVGVDHSTEQL